MKILFKNAAVMSPVCDRNRDDYFVAVDGSVISYVGLSKPEGEFDRVIDCKNKLLTAGFYNAHCHSAMTLFRGYGEDLPLDRWLHEKIFPAEERLTHESVYAGSALAIAEMIACGTVSFTDMYEKCEDTAKAVIESGIKANLGRAVLSFDPSENMAGNIRVKEAEALAREYNGAADGRIIVDMALHAEYTNTENSCRFMAEYAKENGYIIQIHMSETESEHNECIARHGLTPAAFFEKCGVLDSPVSAAHCVWVTDEDMEIMASHGVTAVHNPVSNLKLGSGVMPLRRMLERGVNVALGTDGASSNNMLDILGEMRLAAILHKGVSRRADETKAAQMYDLITINGAKSQGRADCGVIEAGKKADIVLIDMDAVSTIPCYDTDAAFAYSVKSSNVAMTMVDGRVLYENGEYKTIDVEKIKYDFKEIQKHYFD